MTIAIIIILAFMAVIALALQGLKKLKSQVISVEKDLCTGCGRCMVICPMRALRIGEGS